MPFEDSLPDDRCAKCGALRQDHVAWGQRHLFIPADAETAGEPEEEDEHCTCSSRETDGNGRIMHYYGCGMPKPEAPEEQDPEDDHDWYTPDGDGLTCRTCGLRHKLWGGQSCIKPEPEAPDLCEIPHETIEEEDECERQRLLAMERERNRLEMQAIEAPRRPPVAVAYVLQDGTPFEIALPGDATVRSEDGVLIIMHSQSPVKGLVQVKPWEDQ